MKSINRQMKATLLYDERTKIRRYKSLGKYTGGMESYLHEVMRRDPKEYQFAYKMRFNLFGGMEK